MPLPRFVFDYSMAAIETRRLILRPFQAEDLDCMAKLMANPDFMRFSSGTYSREETAAFLEKVLSWQRAGLPSPFAVVLRDSQCKIGCNGTLLGYCGFFHQLIDGKKEIEIGYRLHPDYWNKGIATEAASAVRDHAFHDLKLSRVISLIHPENIASRRVAERVGMQFERETVFKGCPAEIFAMHRDCWRASCGA
jgi:RimJ/RimL family protein N-acetyltransferase